jgi:3-deoxy-manno-octulosonate cytidylyltransferase (CMP-KDO synthetase)
VKAAASWVTRAGGGRGAVREVADAILRARADAIPDARTQAPLDALATDDSEFEVVIPARYASTRLPGKPLRPLGGEPLVAHVWRRAVESGARSVVVATDDERVRGAVEAFGGVARMTSAAHPSGADRAAEVADRLDWPDDAVLVNLQGDEPFMAPDLVRRVASNLHRYPDVGIATLATPIREPGELLDPNVVKVVRDDRECALYFSRAPIPWVRGAFESGAGALRELPGGVPFLRHVGLYAYRVGILRRICGEKPRAEEAAESLEQLRALSLGVPIHVDVVPGAVARGVDTEEDLIRAERELRNRTA